MDYFVYSPIDTFTDFLRNDGKGAGSKDYEIIAAIAMARFCEVQWNEECEIGLPITAARDALLPKSGELSIDEMIDLFRKGLEENSPVDFAVRSVAKVEAGKKHHGIYVQTKRFGRGRKNTSTDALIEFINGQCYQSLHVTLLIVLETGHEIEVGRIPAALKKDFPFERLMTFSKLGDKIHFMEFYPNQGMNEYDFESFF